MREYYWVCISEKRIYHSRPVFNTIEDKDLMKSFGITKQETWIKISQEKALKYASKWKPHYVYSAYTTAEWQIIDCPELLQYQIDQRLEGRYIPMMNYKPIEEQEIVIDFVTDLSM